MVKSPRRVSKNYSRRILWLIVGILASVQVYVSTLQWRHHQPHNSIADADNQHRVTETRNQSATVASPGIASPGTQKQPKWAYAFLVAGVDPERPLTYRNYFYNILVASNLLDVDVTKSTGDVIVMIQFTTATNATELLGADLAWLRTTFPNNPNRKLRIHYLPPLIRDNFYGSQLQKFRILELVEYSRILYLDADVMPLCNLDYLFELSHLGKLQPNIVMAGFTEPAQGGFFLLEPGEGNYEQLLQIIEIRETTIKWNDTLGWGAVMKEEWKGIPTTYGPENRARSSKLWGFHGGFADQGLLYYWTRFHKQNVSIIFLDSVEHWQNGKLLGISESTRLLGNRTCLPIGMEKQGYYGSAAVPIFTKSIPHRDFIHFTGNRKPWEVKMEHFPQSLQEVQSSTAYW